AQIDRLALLEVISGGIDKLWFYYIGRDAANATHRDMAVPLRDIVEAFPDSGEDIIVERAAFPWFERILYARDLRVRFGGEASPDSGSVIESKSSDETVSDAHVSRVSAKSFEDLFVNPARHHLSAGRDMRIASVENPEDDDCFAPDIRDVVVKRVWDYAIRHGVMLSEALDHVWPDIRREALVTRTNSSFMLARTSEHLALLEEKCTQVRKALGPLRKPARFTTGQVDGVVGNVRDTWLNGFAFTVTSGKPSEKHDRFLWRALARWLFLPTRPPEGGFMLIIVNLRDPKEDIYTLHVPLDDDAYLQLQEQFMTLAAANKDVCIPVYVDDLKVSAWTEVGKSVDFDAIEGELERRIEKWDVETRRYLDQQGFTRTDGWDVFLDVVLKVNDTAPKKSSKDKGTKDA
ncbi:MAG: hypothetical protein ACKO14_00160, partial [Armatimonadota bacterium]